jgi:hypothetical protein
MILELNARPGLNIQIANDVGLMSRVREVERHLADDALPYGGEIPGQRVRWSQDTFSGLLKVR